MSGIFGIYDPEGPDRERLLDAAAVEGWRGDPQVVVEGPVALGWWERPGDQVGLVDNGRALLVADARVDGFVAGTPAERVWQDQPGGLAFLGAVLAQSGAEGLDGVAADFALARYDRDRAELLLARDIAAQRPLFWASADGSLTFSSECSVLIALGADAAPDFQAFRAFLHGGSGGGGHTGLAEVRRLRGGYNLRCTGGAVTAERWFRPEDTFADTRDPEVAVEQLQQAVEAALIARCVQRWPALLLSGGRDSASVAIGLSRAGITATCITATFPPATRYSEVEQAREVAEASGHEWIPAPASSRVAEVDLLEMARIHGPELGFFCAQETLAHLAAGRVTGANVLFEGHWGDRAFAAPVGKAIVEYLAQRRFDEAARLGSAARRVWGSASLLVELRRAIVPGPLSRWRARRSRVAAPWVLGKATDPLSREGNSHRERTRFHREFVTLGGWPEEGRVRAFAIHGMQRTLPLADRRVVHGLCRWDLSLRTSPTGRARPVQEAAFLGDVSSRVHLSYEPVYEHFAAMLYEGFPEWRGSESMLARLNIIEPKAFPRCYPEGTAGQTLALFAAEARLRVHEAWRPS